MTLPVTFHRAANAEFIEAAAWYEAQRPGLGPEFERCDALRSLPAGPNSMLWFTTACAASPRSGFRIASTFARKRGTSSLRLCFTEAETRLSGAAPITLKVTPKVTLPIADAPQRQITARGRNFSHATGKPTNLRKPPSDSAHTDRSPVNLNSGTLPAFPALRAQPGTPNEGAAARRALQEHKQ